MTAQIYAFPVSSHVGMIDQLTLGYVERIAQRGESLPYLRQHFAILEDNKLTCGVSVEAVRCELIDLPHSMAGEAQRVFEIDMSGIAIDVSVFGALFVLERSTTYSKRQLSGLFYQSVYSKRQLSGQSTISLHLRQRQHSVF